MVQIGDSTTEAEFAKIISNGSRVATVEDLTNISGGSGGSIEKTGDGSTTEFRHMVSTSTDVRFVLLQEKTEAASADFHSYYDTATEEIVIQYGRAPANGEPLKWDYTINGSITAVDPSTHDHAGDDITPSSVSTSNLHANTAHVGDSQTSSTRVATMGDLNSATGGGLWYDVTNNGAAGDGTTDDTAAIQGTINEAEADGGGNVYFPSGDYMISSAIIGGSGVTLHGEGPYQAIIHQTNPAEHGIDLQGASNLAVEGLGITHDHGLNVQDNGQCLFSGGALTNVDIRRCSFREPARQGVGLWSSGNQNVRFINNDLRACVRAGVVIFGEGIFVNDNYINGTGDDGIALNTDATTHCTISNNIVINGAGVGEQTGGSIKYHGRNMTISNNVVIDTNQFGIRGQIVASETGAGTAQPPTRNIVTGNVVRNITNINPNTTASAALELRDFENVVISNNGVYDVAPYDAIRIRNSEVHTTHSKVTGNYIESADVAVNYKDPHAYADFSNNTVVNVDRVAQIDDPIEAFHMYGNSGDGVNDRTVSFSGLASGNYHIRNNWYSNSASVNGVEGSVTGGTIHNFLNMPDLEPSSIRDGATTYQAIRWSDLMTV